MAEIMQKVWKLFTKTFDDSALLEGISDIVVVKWDSGKYKSTPFIACFGSLATTALKDQVKVYINNSVIEGFNFTLDKYGYVCPMKPSQQIIAKLGLNKGKNIITFQLSSHHTISSEIYLYDQHDKILVSDVDGTLTKNDIGGIYNNFHGSHYLHEGYYQLIEALNNRGVKILWLTMRSLPLYQFSKNYIKDHTKIDGPLITEPEQFLPAVTKQILKKTANVKANMLQTIKQLFPEDCDPFIGGLGNRQNDAIAYRGVGIPLQSIFIVNTSSDVHHFGNTKQHITYHEMSINLNKYFPMPKKGYRKSVSMAFLNPEDFNLQLKYSYTDN